MIDEEMGQDYFFFYILMYLILLLEWKAQQECARCKPKGEYYKYNKFGKYCHIGYVVCYSKQKKPWFC